MEERTLLRTFRPHLRYASFDYPVSFLGTWTRLVIGKFYVNFNVQTSPYIINDFSKRHVKPNSLDWIWSDFISNQRFFHSYPITKVATFSFASYCRKKRLHDATSHRSGIALQVVEEEEKKEKGEREKRLRWGQFNRNRIAFFGNVVAIEAASLPTFLHRYY